MTNRHFYIHTALFTIALSLGCDPRMIAKEIPDGGDDDGGKKASFYACDPLVAVSEPIELRAVVAAGKDKNGLIYVVDGDSPPDRRLFLSSGSILKRVEIGGSGDVLEGASYTSLYSFVLDGSAQSGMDATLAVKHEDPVRMAVCPGADRRSFSEVEAAGELLSVLDPAEVEEMPVSNLGLPAEVEYVADLRDGRFAVVTRPAYDWTYEDFRAFVGEKGEMIEREVLNVLRATDGGSTHIELVLPGETVDFFFPIVDMAGPGQATLSEGGETTDITWLEDEDLGSFAFSCRTP